MLYDTYQIQSDVLAPFRLMAEFFRGVLTQPWPLIKDAPLVRSAAAAMELLSNAGMSHDRPEFGIRKVVVGGEEVGVTEEVVASHPFCRLLHFRKEGTWEEPTVLVVAPLSGHFSTLLRGTVATLLPDHNVYITDWVNARNIPLLYGPFARLVRARRHKHGAGALSWCISAGLSRLSTACRLSQHEPRPPCLRALVDVSQPDKGRWRKRSGDSRLLQGVHLGHGSAG